MRVLIIGIDGGTWRVLNPAMERGHMPFLKGLVEGGVRGSLASTTPPKTPAAWSAFQTGTNPGKTGIYDFAFWDRHERAVRYASAASLAGTLWELAGAAGRRVAVINVPLTYPPRAVNGYMITGLPTPSLESDFTWPPELRDELLKAVPDYHIFSLGGMSRRAPHRRPRQFIEMLNRIVENRAVAACWLMARGPLDLCMVHFQAPDVVQHVLWGYMDSTHPLYDPALHEYILAEFYGRLDGQMRRVAQAFEACGTGDCLTLVVSDHGFQTHLARVNLGNWLARQGYLVVHPRRQRLGPLSGILRTARKLGLEPLLRWTRFGRKLTMLLDEPAFEFDFSSSRVFSFSRGNDGFVFLLEQDANARAVTESQLRKDLAGLVDPRTRQQVVKSIHRKEEIYAGPKLDLLPDLIVKPADGYSFTGDYQHGVKRLFSPVRRWSDFHVGMHHADGILVASGLGVRRGAQIAGARLVDIAPTVLAVLGVAASPDMDGCALGELFTAGFPAAQRPSKTVAPSANETHQYSQQDVENIERRLRELGYIE